MQDKDDTRPVLSSLLGGSFAGAAGGCWFSRDLDVQHSVVGSNWCDPLRVGYRDAQGIAKECLYFRLTPARLAWLLLRYSKMKEHAAALQSILGGENGTVNGIVSGSGDTAGTDNRPDAERAESLRVRLGNLRETLSRHTVALRLLKAAALVQWPNLDMRTQNAEEPVEPPPVFDCWSTVLLSRSGNSVPGDPRWLTPEAQRLVAWLMAQPESLLPTVPFYFAPHILVPDPAVWLEKLKSQAQRGVSGEAVSFAVLEVIHRLSKIKKSPFPLATSAACEHLAATLKQELVFRARRDSAKPVSAKKEAKKKKR